MYHIVFSAFVLLMSCTALYANQNLTSSECPEYWMKIGVSCYLFAIPEILSIDDSCRVDGKL